MKLLIYSSLVIVTFLIKTSVTQIVFTIVQDAEWEEWKYVNKKFYANQTEDLKRKEIFFENKQFIEDFNELFFEGKQSFSCSVYGFSDLTIDEFNQQNMGVGAIDTSGYGEIDVHTQNLLEKVEDKKVRSIDWRKKGAVTHVKNQNGCSSCWAFAATGAIEGQIFLKHGRLESLSEQHLIDCDEYDDGCDSGWPHYAFHYLTQEEGLETEASYPYEAKKLNCRFKTPAVKCFNYTHPTLDGTEATLERLVANYGPIPVVMDVTLPFIVYKTGIYDNEKCDKMVPNHAMLVVGFDTDVNGVDYWILKNSWGEEWGEKGYIRVARNKNNICGIANYGSIPEVE
jgi:cathepsin L